MPDQASYALIHAPLVGPSTWSWVAWELERRGHTVTVPDLTGAGSTADEPFEHCVQSAADAIGEIEGAILVGHSGSGVLLPFIASKLRSRPSGFLFVDAGLPPVTGSLELADGDFRSFLDGLVDQMGRLQPWTQWWGEEAMRSMVPDAGRRVAIEGDLPRLPLRYYDYHPAVPPGWSDTPCGYLLLSKGYVAEAEDARSRGWQIRQLDAQHLHMIVDPEELASALEELNAAIVRGRVGRAGYPAPPPSDPSERISRTRLLR